MLNPFKELLKPALPEGEDVEGSFACQEKGCWNVNGEAIYMDDIELLSWMCKDEHINKVRMKL